MRGLFILKSETDKRRMQLLGNLFTHYNYATVDIHHERTAQSISIHSQKSGLQVQASIDPQSEPDLPGDSPFPSWRKARLFSGPLPFTFSIDRRRQEVVIIEGLRESWNPRPVVINQQTVPFLDRISADPPHLANAFLTENIPYQWRRGRTESLI